MKVQPKKLIRARFGVILTPEKVYDAEKHPEDTRMLVVNEGSAWVHVGKSQVRVLPDNYVHAEQFTMELK